MRFLVGTTEADPSGFDASGTNYGSIHLERSTGPLPPGTYVVTLQAKVAPGGCVGECSELVNVGAFHETIEVVDAS